MQLEHQTDLAQGDRMCSGSLKAAEFRETIDPACRTNSRCSQSRTHEIITKHRSVKPGYASQFPERGIENWSLSPRS